MVTIRQKILDALQTRMETIYPDDVYQGRTIFDPDVDRLPLVTIVAGVETSARTAYRTNSREMPVEVSALISLGGDNDTGVETYKDVTAACEPIYGQIEQACFHGGSEIKIGDDYYQIEFRGGGIVDYPSEPGPAIVTVGVSLAVTYETEIGDPTK